MELKSVLRHFIILFASACHRRIDFAIGCRLEYSPVPSDVNGRKQKSKKVQNGFSRETHARSDQRRRTTPFWRVERWTGCELVPGVAVTFLESINTFHCDYV
jgi:hypothetical protein